MAKLLALLVFLGVMVGSCQQTESSKVTPIKGSGGTQLIEGRALWAHYPYPGNNEESVRDFVDHCSRAHINLIVMCMKGGDGQLYYPSKKFSDAVHVEARKFDILESLVRNAHSKGIRVHAWICDFTENANASVVKEHPDWVVLNPEGNRSDSEVLGGDYGPYDTVWMCPARRPGYVDQYIFPLIEEILTNYQIDGLHHDYVRYPGDVAPDGYCFCDYCLDEFMKWNHFYYDSKPETVFNPPPAITTPRLWIANWWLDYTVRPKDWDKMTRQAKADFILKGRTMAGGPTDMDYFFYEYRCDMMTKYVREFWEFAHKIKPGIEISSAVFKNPALSGRNIGQRWTDFAVWHDVMMPMAYRSHFPGDFETYLDLATEYARYENKWAEGLCHIYFGTATNYLFKEEYEPLNEMSQHIRILQKDPNNDLAGRMNKIVASYNQIKEHLKKCSPALASTFDQNIKVIAEPTVASFNEEISTTFTVLLNGINQIYQKPPEGYFPPEKLARNIEAIRKGGAQGIVIYYSGDLYVKNLWPILEKCFAEPSQEPYIVNPIKGVSIQSVRKLPRK